MFKTIALAALTITLAGTNPNWKLEKEADGIKVYLAKSENTSFKQFKVETFVAASPKEIADAIVDIENNYKWFVNVKPAKMIEEVGPNEFIFSQVIEVPFPFENRQVVQHCLTTSLENGAIRIDLKAKNDAMPENDDYVRMEVATGYWILIPAEGGTNIEYSFLADPSGNIPAWLANQFIVDNPFKTIKGLRAYLADS